MTTRSEIMLATAEEAQALLMLTAQVCSPDPCPWTVEQADAAESHVRRIAARSVVARNAGATKGNLEVGEQPE